MTDTEPPLNAVVECSECGVESRHMHRAFAFREAYDHHSSCGGEVLVTLGTVTWKIPLPDSKVSP